MRPVPLGTTDKLLRSLHRRYIDDAHPRPPWDRLDPSVLDDARREEARSAWVARVVAEYRSMVVFSEMIARFPEAGLPLELTCAATRLLQDEARHTELCARVAEGLGATPDEARVDPKDLRLVDDSLPAHLFVARWTASMFCVGESASVGLLRAMHAEATDPCVRAVIDTLVRDETLHDRFGWALAGVVFPRLTDDEREWLGTDLAWSLAHYDRTNGRSLRRDGEALPAAAEPDPAQPNLGVIDPLRYARAWYQRLDEVILPAFVALGVPAYEAWALRHEALQNAGENP